MPNPKQNLLFIITMRHVTDFVRLATIDIVAVKVFRTITHIIASAMLVRRVYTLMECPSLRGVKTRRVRKTFAETIYRLLRLKNLLLT